jgi:DNA/RNA-binding domain of Phe-tRNA-synthetase-like protein
MDEVATHPRLISWRGAYWSLGAKSSKFRASIEAMIRRVVSNNKLPPINAIVDIGNLQLCVK